MVFTYTDGFHVILIIKSDFDTTIGIKYIIVLIMNVSRMLKFLMTKYCY